MTDVRDWAVGLCTAAVGLSIVLMILPDGRMKKTVTVLVGVTFFCCLIEPIGEWARAGATWLRVPLSETEVSEELTRLTDEQIDAAIASALCRDAQSRLADYSVSVTEASFERDTSAVDGIYIHRVDLTVRGERLPRDAYIALELAWGVEVEVYYDDT